MRAAISSPACRRPEPETPSAARPLTALEHAGYFCYAARPELLFYVAGYILVLAWLARRSDHHPWQNNVNMLLSVLLAAMVAMQLRHFPVAAVWASFRWVHASPCWRPGRHGIGPARARTDRDAKECGQEQDHDQNIDDQFVVCHDSSQSVTASDQTRLPGAAPAAFGVSAPLT
jgi:hypothetical protein